MEDNIQIILYIIFVVFAIVSRLFKGNKSQPAKRPKRQQTDDSQRRATKQMSFEELLKEFTEGDDSSTSKSESWQAEEENVIDDAEIQRIYERSIQESKRYEKPTPADERHTGNFTHFEHYSEEDTKEQDTEFGRILDDPDELRKGIILKEILDRKY